MRWLPLQGTEQRRDRNLGEQLIGFACESDEGCERKSQGQPRGLSNGRKDLSVSEMRAEAGAVGREGTELRAQFWAGEV